MTAQEIGLVRKTWKIVRGLNPVSVGDLWYSKMIADHLINKRQLKAIDENFWFTLFEMINEVIGQLEYSTQLPNALDSLVYYVKTNLKNVECASPFFNAILWTLQKILGNDWCEAVSKAWQSCLYWLTFIKNKDLVPSEYNVFNNPVPPT